LIVKDTRVVQLSASSGQTKQNWAEKVESDDATSKTEATKASNLTGSYIQPVDNNLKLPKTNDTKATKPTEVNMI
jgi:hypothetical protein